MIRAWRPALLLLAGAPVSGARRPPPPALFRYTVAQLDCAAFEDHATATLEAETGARRRRETITRNGLLRFRARASAGVIAVEAWWDSLALSRRSPEATLAPATDGILGGRYRGALSPSGRYAPEARPFVPDDVAEVADLGTALDDLLPPLPPEPLAVGQRWIDGVGLELKRLADSVVAGRRLLRLALHARTETDTALIRGDTTQLAATQVTVEDGEIDWDAAGGLVRRVRHIVVETTVPAGGPLKLPLRSRLGQEATLVRRRRECQP